MRLARQLTVLVMIAAACFALPLLRQTANAQTPPASVPSFTMPVQKAAVAGALDRFIEKHPSQLVYLDVQISPQFARVGDKIQNRDDLFVSTEPCGASVSASECAGSHYLLSGKNYVLQSQQGSIRLTGYFMIGASPEMHQGMYYSLKSIPAAQAQLHK